MPKISLLLITKNESENLKKWAKWLPKIDTVAELIVVDGESSDDTVKIAKSLSSDKLKVSTINGAGDADFSTQRNLGLKHCQNDLILWLDADEQPSPALVSFLNNGEIKSNTNYSFKREDIFLGQKLKHGETSNQYFTRLFNKNSGFFTGLVHEVWTSKASTTNLNLTIIHSPNCDFRKFITKINFYTDLRSQELFKSGIKTNLFQIIFYPIAKFIQNYFFRLGFLDGTQGIILAISMSFHSFLVRAKLWTLLNP